MTVIHRFERNIPNLTGLVVLTTATAAFLLSFLNLRSVAIESGFDSTLAFLWPVCVDALLVGGSLMILRSSLRGEPAWLGWVVLIAFTGISTAFNISHSPDTFSAQAAHAVPPLALCISIELLMRCIRSDLTTNPMDPDLAQSGTQPCNDETPVLIQEVTPVGTPGYIDDHSPISHRLNEHVHDESVVTPEFNREVDGVTTKPIADTLVNRIGSVSDEEIMQLFLDQPEISIKAAASLLGVSRTTLGRRMTKLKEQGRFVRTGIGVHSDGCAREYRSNDSIESIH